jgi:hypothetical protein
MPTKSGRIKLEDVRQGKTIWIASKPLPHKVLTGPEDNLYQARGFMVVEGAKLRCAGIRWLDAAGIFEAYSYPAFSLSPVYADQYSSTLDRLLLTHFFHPDRNKDIGILPDGSHYHIHAFTTRRKCQRHCDELNREQFLGYIDNFVASSRAKYAGAFVAPDLPWHDDQASAVPGNDQ